MFTCYECKEILSTNRDLLEHVKIAHPFLKKYRCSEYACKQIFSRFFSFWKHRTRDHEQNSEVYNDKLNFDPNSVTKNVDFALESNVLQEHPVEVNFDEIDDNLVDTTLNEPALVSNAESNFDTKEKQNESCSSNAIHDDME